MDAGTAAAGGVKPWLREILQEKLDAAERAGDEGAVNNIRALCPDHVCNRRGDGGVDSWISLTKQMQQLWQQQMQLVEAAVRHKRKAAEQEERAIEIRKSISQLRMRLTNTEKESEAKLLDEKFVGLCGRGDQEGVPRPSNWNVPQPSEWQKSRRQAD